MIDASLGRVHVRRAELFSAIPVAPGLCELRLVYRNAPMRCAIDVHTARELRDELNRFITAQGST
jgi:hypothetical protein